jgi:hypothetical protein
VGENVTSFGVGPIEGELVVFVGEEVGLSVGELVGFNVLGDIVGLVGEIVVKVGLKEGVGGVGRGVGDLVGCIVGDTLIVPHDPSCDATCTKSTKVLTSGSSGSIINICRVAEYPAVRVELPTKDRLISVHLSGKHFSEDSANVSSPSPMTTIIRVFIVCSCSQDAQ